MFQDNLRDYNYAGVSVSRGGLSFGHLNLDSRYRGHVNTFCIVRRKRNQEYIKIVKICNKFGKSPLIANFARYFRNNLLILNYKEGLFAVLVDIRVFSEIKFGIIYLCIQKKSGLDCVVALNFRFFKIESDMDSHDERRIRILLFP